MWNLLDGLVYLNTLDVMHRDIKPENIMLKKRDNNN